MSRILKYFSFLRQLKGHKASNKLVTKDSDLKFEYKNGFLADSEALCMCPCSFDFSFLNSKLSSEKIKELFIACEHGLSFTTYCSQTVNMGSSSSPLSLFPFPHCSPWACLQVKLFINFRTFDFRPRYLPKYVDIRDFLPKDLFLRCVEALHQISASQVECKWKKGRFFEGQSFHILLKSDLVLSIDQNLV